MVNEYKGENAGKYEKVIKKTPDQITKLGVARTFQNIRLFSNLTVFDNVLIAKHMRAKQNIFSATFRLNAKEEKRMRQEALDLLKMQDMLHLKDEIASSLPYGLQRRVEIARALATEPHLLLLDEPAAGMNPQETLELTDFIIIRIDDADRHRLFGRLGQLFVCQHTQALFGQWTTVACDAHGVITRYIHVAHNRAIVKLVLHRIR